MPDAMITGRMSEPQFAALVGAIAADPARRGRLVDLLREDHAVYDGRGTAAIVRMRGWILLAMARTGVSDAELVFVLEELDTGTDPYLVGAAARALRSYPRPHAGLAPLVAGALDNIRRRDEPLSFGVYGEYAVEDTGISAVGELLTTLAWLGPQARGVLADLEALRAPAAGLSRKRRLDLERTLGAIRDAGLHDDGPRDGGDAPSCCGGPLVGPDKPAAAATARPASSGIGSIVLQDHRGEASTFKAFFEGQPSIVVFFYTRCDNPMKCSLTIAKLARVQRLLESRGLADRIRTAAITYDPAFDLPERLRVYGRDRDVRLDVGHRMFRAIEGDEVLREHFGLGVNYVGSLVNRHRIELFVLDAEGRVAVSFERLRWDEVEVVDRAQGALERRSGKKSTRQQTLSATPPTDNRWSRRTARARRPPRS
jgi:protein SCO1/2